MPGGPYDPAIVAGLTETIAWELGAQLALSGLDLDPDRIEALAVMVADQVLTEWHVTPRPDSPTAAQRS